MDKPYVLITGASSAIGSEISQILSLKYNLIIHGRNAEKLEKLKSQLGCIVTIWEYDLSNTSTLLQDFASLLEKNNINNVYGYIHVAGSTAVFPIRTSSMEQWYDMFNINLFASISILQVLLKKKYKQNFKSCVYLSSTYAHFGGKGQAAYCSSKAAIEGFIRSAAVELSPNIRVNCIVPGGIITDKYSTEDEYTKNLELAHLLGFGKPIDIANMVEYLISEKSIWITGQCFIVDGGYSINNLK